LGGGVCPVVRDPKSNTTKVKAKEKRKYLFMAVSLT
jgi:hypothetical protein